MAIIHVGQTRLFGAEFDEVAAMHELRQELAASRAPFETLPSDIDDIKVLRISQFTGSLFPSPELSYIVTDTSTAQAQETLINNGVFDFSQGAKVAGVAHLRPNLAIIHRGKLDSPRVTERLIVHELSHLNGITVAHPAKDGKGLEFGTSGLREVKTDGTEKNLSEEGWVQALAAGYDKLYYPGQQDETTRVGNLEVPSRYVDHPSQPNMVLISGIAAVATELLIHKKPSLAYAFSDAHSKLDPVHKSRLRYAVNGLAPEADLYDRINSQPTDAKGCLRILDIVTREVYPDGDIPHHEEIGVESQRFLKDKIERHTDQSTLGRFRRWVERNLS